MRERVHLWMHPLIGFSLGTTKDFAYACDNFR